MRSINKVILLGRLGKTPEIKEFDNGKIANATLATTRSWKNKQDEWQEETQWHNLVARGYSADALQKNADKGSIVAVEGEVRYRSYEVDGVKKFVTEIHVDSVSIIKADGSTSGAGEATSSPEDDDLPF